MSAQARRTWCFAVLALAAASVAGAGGASADTVPDPRPIPSLTVEGRASVPVVPDTVLISLGIVTDRPRAADAMGDNSRATKALIETIGAAGVEAQDVATTAVGLSPLYETTARSNPKVTGYRASNMLQIRVKPADRAGPLIGQLTDKGANSIDSIAFSVSPDPKRDDQLRVDAMRDARHKAQVYVEALGLRLGRVLGIAPESAPVIYPVGGFAKAAISRAAEPVPLAAGSQDQEAQVSVTFEILQ